MKHSRFHLATAVLAVPLAVILLYLNVISRLMTEVGFGVFSTPTIEYYVWGWPFEYSRQSIPAEVQQVQYSWGAIVANVIVCLAIVVGTVMLSEYFCRRISRDRNHRDIPVQQKDHSPE
jgi:hypothetical protein